MQRHGGRVMDWLDLEALGSSACHLRHDLVGTARCAVRRFLNLFAFAGKPRPICICSATTRTDKHALHDPDRVWWPRITYL